MAVDEDARARRERRLKRLQIERFDLADMPDMPDDSLWSSTTVEERLGMMWPLAVRAWRLSGRELPSYTRAEMPGRVIRGKS